MHVGFILTVNSSWSSVVKLIWTFMLDLSPTDTHVSH